VWQALQSTLPTVPWKSAQVSMTDAAAFLEISASWAIWSIRSAFSIAITSAYKRAFYPPFLMQPTEIGFYIAKKSEASLFCFGKKL
jgi:hypothetical protein